MRTIENTRPFLYVIGWTAHDTWYLGVRYAKGCQPDSLWTTYFTSSKYVAEFRSLNGDPDHIEVIFEDDRDGVLKKEQAYILEWNLHRDPRWLNRSAGGLFCPDNFIRTPEWEAKRRGAIMAAYTPEKRQELSDKRKGVPIAGVSERMTDFWSDPERKAVRIAAQIAGRNPDSDGKRAVETRMVTGWGQTRSLAEWLQEYPSITAHQFSVRINQGWSVEDALTRLPRPRRTKVESQRIM